MTVANNLEDITILDRMASINMMSISTNMSSIDAAVSGNAAAMSLKMASTSNILQENRLSISRNSDAISTMNTAVSGNAAAMSRASTILKENMRNMRADSVSIFMNM